MKKQRIKKFIAGMMLPVTALSALVGCISYSFLSCSENVGAMYVNNMKYDIPHDVNIGGFHYLDSDYSYTHAKIADVYTHNSYYDEEYETTVHEYSSSVNQGNRLLTFTIDLANTNNTNIYIDVVLTYNAKNYEYGTGAKKVSLYRGLAVDNKSVVIPFTTPADMDSSKISYIDVSASRSGNYSESDMYFECIAKNLMLSDGDTMAPVLETQVFLADVDDPKDIEYILSNYKFHDEVDGDIPITTDMIVTDNYTANKNKVGKWDIVVKATDEAGNSATATIQVWVQDKTSPLITGPTTFTSNMSNPLTIDSILAQLTATDNVDGDISENINVVSNEFTGNEQITGNKDIVINVTDTAGNVSATTTLKVNCVDDIKPVITGTSSYTSSYKVSISDDTILSAINYSDNITVKSDMTLEEISDTYRGNQSIPGTYTRVFRVVDGAGNISEVFTVEIKVVDEIPPVFMANGFSIGVSKAQSLTHQELVNILIYMQGLQNDGVSVEILSNEYEVDEFNAPGTYSLSYRIMKSTGEVGEEQTATINVLGEKEAIKNDTQVQVEQRVNSLWSKIVRIFKNIGEFFMKLLKSLAWIFTFGKVDPQWDEWY